MLGVSEMDDEHIILVDRINKLIEQIEQQYRRKDAQALLTTFSNLANFTNEHFSHEEAYMRSIGYRQLTSHQKIHQNLLSHIESYGNQIKNETLNDQKLISFLRNWLLSHIMGVDMQYAQFQKGNSHYKSGVHKHSA